ncbi:CLUMA_CG020066, isoform A [Clunio marinus]|uniref:CLUMA_CG020066, isoform A n=1 Tax=Clunio marinus TaxID=568069 RepID=A0A1J1J3E6_9DIPT|nr:CLUMA_CG020066, isoform A [Clunio marinus]
MNRKESEKHDHSTNMNTYVNLQQLLLLLPLPLTLPRLYGLGLGSVLNQISKYLSKRKEKTFLLFAAVAVKQVKDLTLRHYRISGLSKYLEISFKIKLIPDVKRQRSQK